MPLFFSKYCPNSFIKEAESFYVRSLSSFGDMILLLGNVKNKDGWSRKVFPLTFTFLN